MNAYLITGDCGDYYCGCGIGHFIAVTLEPEMVEELIESAKVREHSYAKPGKLEYRTYKNWLDVRVIEVPLDTIVSSRFPDKAGMFVDGIEFFG